MLEAHLSSDQLLGGVLVIQKCHEHVLEFGTGENPDQLGKVTRA